MNEKIWDLLIDNWKKILSPEIRLMMDLSLSMSKMELIALVLIGRSGETMMTQLAESLHIPMSTATGVISRLAKQGYVDRYTDESNRRIVNVRLTQQGKDTVENIKQTVMKYWGMLTEFLSDEEKDVLNKLFSKISASFSSSDSEDHGDVKNITKIRMD